MRAEAGWRTQFDSGALVVPGPLSSPVVEKTQKACRFHSGGTDAPAVSRSDRLRVGVFWVWAGLLLVATVAQLLGWEGVLDVLDVKRWF